MTAYKMKLNNLARKYEHQFGAQAIDLDQVAIQKDQDYKNETTAWIFEDGSALTLSDNIIGIVDDYGLSKDHEQL